MAALVLASKPLSWMLQKRKKKRKGKQGKKEDEERKEEKVSACENVPRSGSMVRFRNVKGFFFGENGVFLT